MEHDVFVGVDWGSDQHQVCLLRGPRFEPEQRSFAHSSAGLQDLADWLAARCQGQPERLGVAIEVPHGPVVEGLLERGLAVYALNPKQLDRFRDRHSAAGAKDDRRDALVLADALRTDQRFFRRLVPDDPRVVQLREASRCDEELAREQNGLANRLREQLRRYWPALLAIARDDLVDPFLWALLERYRTPEQALRARPAAATRLLKAHRIRRLSADQVLAALHTPPLRLSPGTAAAASEHVLLLVPRLRLVTAQREQCTARLAALIEELAAPDEDPQSARPTDVAILRSLPGVGTRVLARLLGEAAQPLADRNLAVLRTHGGLAPVTKQSGKSCWVAMRRACSSRLRLAFYPWSFAAMQHDPAARAHYLALRAKGHSHARALRGLMDRLLSVALAMLRDGTFYDPTRRSKSVPDSP